MIASIHNERIKEARKLHDARARRRSGLFLLEGVRLVADARAARARFAAVYYDLEAASAAPLVAELAAAGIDCTPVTPAVLASLAETVTPQGIVAVVATPDLPAPSAPDFTLILDRLREPGNAGTLLRSAEAAGVQLVLFAAESVDPFNGKAVRAAMGAHFRLPIRTCAGWPQVQTWLQPQQRLYLAEAHADLDYDEVDWRQPAALVIGGEASGAGAEARAAAQPVRIPMLGGSESLNAAVAGAVILFEAARQRRLR